MSQADLFTTDGAKARVDHMLIAEMVEAGSRVLDVGCGDGELLRLLSEKRGVDGRGVELQRDKVNACVARGLSVIQGDADRDLDNYPDQAFDYAILSLTIQATRKPQTVLENLLRIGKRAIVSFPNFGHWRVRSSLAFGGRMPVNDNLPDLWYLTPNAHLCTIRDFADLCERIDAKVERAVAFSDYGRPLPIKWSLSMQNLFGEKAVFLLRSSSS
ncbi:methionine biosynthesis protein MetW [Hyphomicrobium methylovorum]|uniref:methionine biosynthesis protein MetW n=1 Tax=Hyphomicrobium methylovorum TaxID=84 RepID=UPI0015E73F7F|nr:methionine biosynthesis protein MetW [Hyphomicrobium methylovorum]MBA2125747.1 methionine biosynthesis protein MetW [Hyphomicrobium methylovorum]